MKIKSYINNENKEALYVLVHGKAGNINIMSPFKHAIPKDANIAMVEAPYQDPLGGYSWWLNNQDQPLIEEQMRYSQETLFQFLQTEKLKFKKLITLGFSQGGILLSLIIQQNPKIIDGIALLSSFFKITRPQNWWQEHKDALPMLFIAHGKKDPIITYNDTITALNKLITMGYPKEKITLVVDNTEHKVGSLGMKKLKLWLLSFEMNN